MKNKSPLLKMTVFTLMVSLLLCNTEFAAPIKHAAASTVTNKVTAAPSLTAKRKKPKATPTPRPKSKKHKATPTPTPKPKKKPTPAPKPAKTAENKIILTTGFETGDFGFGPRGAEEVVAVTDKTAHSGKYSLKVSGRTNSWNGAELDMTGTLLADHTYNVTAWVKYENGAAPQIFYSKINRNNGQSYDTFAQTQAVKGTWTQLKGTMTIPSDAAFVRFYFETAMGTEDFYIDDVELTESGSVDSGTDTNIAGPGLADAYKDYFDIGAATSGTVLSSPLTKSIVLSQFSTITMENEFKPVSLLDYRTSVSDLDKYNLSPAINYAVLDKYLKFAQDNGLKVRFHTLVWHNQTPQWFFKENYSFRADAANASRDVMLKRMENYIKQIMEYTRKYPGVIYAWDVVNEAIEPVQGNTAGLRTQSLWYQTVGEDFIEKAFEYARKYSYDDAGLFYNDYNTYEMPKRTHIYNLLKKLKDKGLVDGIGMQSHINMTYPTLTDYEAAIKKYSELGLIINVTELDMHNTDNSAAALKKQAERYGELFKLLIKLKKDGTANITNVTFWGVLDTMSWLKDLWKTVTYPLLYDGSGKPKPSYYSILEAVK